VPNDNAAGQRRLKINACLDVIDLHLNVLFVCWSIVYSFFGSPLASTKWLLVDLVSTQKQ